VGRKKSAPNRVPLKVWSPKLYEAWDEKIDTLFLKAYPPDNRPNRDDWNIRRVGLFETRYWTQSDFEKADRFLQARLRPERRKVSFKREQLALFNEEV